MRIAINGFGRIGRSFLRALLKDADAAQLLDVAVINMGPALVEHAAYAFKYDTIMGTYPGEVTLQNNHLIINDKKIQVVAEYDPKDVDWCKYKVDWVVDCSGCFTHREQAEKHLAAGCNHVLISAPAHDEDITIIPGVNESHFDTQKHRIVALGSCTTNAFIPLLDVLHNAFDLTSGTMTTIHAYTNSQVLLDVDCGSKDVRRSRAAALNIIPTTTGAARLVKKIIPALGDTITARAVRVPVGDVSLIEFAFVAKKAFTAELINEVFYNASQKNPHIVGVSTEPLVSSDYIGDPRSVVIDGLLTMANHGIGKVSGWYDNEWGYSCRLKDFLVMVAR